jgi:quercetin dioxygenase-like cupin family protein
VTNQTAFKEASIYEPSQRVTSANGCSQPTEGCVLTGRFLPNVFRIAALAGVCALQSQSVAGQERPSITHTPLLKSDLPNTPGQEVIVWDTQHAPGAVNPRHLHPAAITFHVLSGTGVWQEDGKAAVTLHAGDNLFVPAGTIHAHWNPSKTDPLRFLEFIVADKDKSRAIPQPPKN